MKSTVLKVYAESSRVQSDSRSQSTRCIASPYLLKPIKFKNEKAPLLFFQTVARKLLSQLADLYLLFFLAQIN